LISFWKDTLTHHPIHAEIATLSWYES
ncbi:hypothetical protein A4X06_0g9546, partial [Tilletia controversa]